MGITISGPNKSIDMGGGGFANLRTTIAKLLNCNEFFELYDDLVSCGHCRYAEKGFATKMVKNRQKNRRNVCYRLGKLVRQARTYQGGYLWVFVATLHLFATFWRQVAGRNLWQKV